MSETIDGVTVVGFNPIVLRGDDGRSVTGAALDANQNLVVTFSDGSSTNVGMPAPAAGALPSVGAFTYNGDGTVASDADGNAYTYNGDGTVHTITRGPFVRTLTYNGDGTIASVT
jgi:hypothetical protein